MYMFKYVTKRLGLMLFTFLIIVVMSFILIKLLPIRPLDGGNALMVLADSSIYFKIMETGFRIVFAAVILAAAVYLKSVFLLLFLIYVLFVCRI